MGEDNIAPGRQCFLEGGMEKRGGYTPLKRTPHTATAEQQEVPDCKSITSTNSGKQSFQGQQFACTREPRENKLKDQLAPFLYLGGTMRNSIPGAETSTYKVWGTCDAAVKVNRELQNVLLL